MTPLPPEEPSHPTPEEQQEGDSLFESAYAELRKVASAYLSRERPGHTLQPTALVHEAWFRLSRREQEAWNDRGHFYASAARAMRLILVDHAKSRRRRKRGGGRRPASLDPRLHEQQQGDEWLEALDDALSELATRDPRQAKIVEYRFFGGFTVGEVAAALGISRATVERDWRIAKAWITKEIGESTDSPPNS